MAHNLYPFHPCGWTMCWCSYVRDSFHPDTVARYMAWIETPFIYWFSVFNHHRLYKDYGGEMILKPLLYNCVAGWGVKEFGHCSVLFLLCGFTWSNLMSYMFPLRFKVYFLLSTKYRSLYYTVLYSVWFILERTFQFICRKILSTFTRQY